MNLKQILKCESNEIQRLQKRLMLPNYFIKIGIAVAAAAMIGQFFFRFYIENPDTYLMFGGRLLLVGLLLIAISKEPIEDEMIVNLRSSAFMVAFIWGVIYAVFQPFINLFFMYMVKPEKAEYEDLSVFIILWTMLVIHLLFFHVMKPVR